jgi:hypothetical protein
VQARRAAVTIGRPAPAPPIPHGVGVLRSVHACYTRWAPVALQNATGTRKSNGYPEAWTVGPRSGGRCAHQRGSPARSRLPRPDVLDRASKLKPRLERRVRRVVAIAGLMTGVAWLIPYCARRRPLHLKDNGCRGSACSPLSEQEGRRPQTARVRRAHYPPLPGTISPVCATREHVRPPALQAPLVTCAVREHGGLAWPPRLSALRQRRLVTEVLTHTRAGRASIIPILVGRKDSKGRAGSPAT